MGHRDEEPPRARAVEWRQAVTESESDEILTGLGAVEEAVSRLQERLVRIEKLVEQIALSLGISIHG